jgi:general secretion pathway protein D
MNWIQQHRKHAMTVLIVVVAGLTAPSLRAQDEPAAPVEPPTPPPVTRTPVVAPPPPSEPVNVPAENGNRKLDKIEFSNASLSAVLEYYAMLTKRTLIPAPNLAAQVTFRAQGGLTVNEAIQALDSVLALNGFATVPVGEKFLKVVQIAAGKQEVPPINIGREGILERDSLITQIIPLKFADANEAVQAVQPYLHSFGQLIPLLKSNSLMITDTANNVKRLLEIINYVDQPTAVRMEHRIYQIKFARAADILAQLQSIIQGTQQGTTAPTRTAPSPIVRPPVPGAPPAPPVPVSAAGDQPSESVVEGKVIMTSDERTNKLFIMSRIENFAFFDKMIGELDAQVDPDVVIEVIELDFATAEELAGLLNSVVTGASPPTTATRTTSRARSSTSSSSSSRSTRTTTTPTPSTPTPSPSTTVAGAQMLEGFLEYPEGVRIIPDQRLNALMIVATKTDMARIKGLISTLDSSVPQVLVEVIIAEVNLGDGLQTGVEWVKRLEKHDDVTHTGATSTGRPPKPQDLNNLSGELLNNAISNAPGIALASLSGGLTYFATFNGMDLDMMVRLLATDSKFKVLSTPIIQTMNNQEARITVGEQRPVPTEAVSDVVSNDSTAVRQNIEYRDIAIELTVTPRINPDGYVSMDIHQTINDVGGNIPLNGTLVPIITLREAQSMVSVKDQSTIVLGGLIKESKDTAETKVPFLGDIPFFGNLFKGKESNSSRNELIVFIKPTVLRSDQASAEEAIRRAKLLKAGKELELEKRFLSPTATGMAIDEDVGKRKTKAAPSTPTEPVEPADPQWRMDPALPPEEK